MTTYTCDRCLKCFDKHSNYVYHTEKRKTLCKKASTINTDEKICEYCNKEFSRTTNLRRHLLACKFKEMKQQNNLLVEELIKQKNQNKILKDKNGTTINNTTNNIYNTINNNTTIINNNNINCYLVNHGSEDYGDVDLKNIFDGESILLKFIEELHCNKNKPEYHNILITDNSRNIVQVYENNKWNVDNKNNVIHSIIGRTIKQLDNVKDSFRSKYRNKYDEEFNIYILGTIDNYHLEHNKKLKKQIGNSIYNNKDMIKETKKLMEENKTYKIIEL